MGILVSVICQVLKHSGRDEQAFLTSLAGLVMVLFWMIPYIYDLFESHEAAVFAVMGGMAMNMLTLGAAGIAAVLLAVWMNGSKGRVWYFCGDCSPAFLPFLWYRAAGRDPGYSQAVGAVHKDPAGVSHNTFKDDRYYLQCRICLRDL